MKQKPSTLLALSALILFVAMVSCTKQGPAGATGPGGPKGPAGDTGQAGPAGNANVIVSAWTSGFSGTFAQWQVPVITYAVLDSSVVLVYCQFGGSTDMDQLPFDNVDGSGFYINDDINFGIIDLYCGYAQNLSQYSFRYVIIPPGVAGTGLPRSYEEMTARLGIAP